MRKRHLVGEVKSAVQTHLLCLRVVVKHVYIRNALDANRQILLHFFLGIALNFSIAQEKVHYDLAFRIRVAKPKRCFQ